MNSVSFLRWIIAFSMLISLACSDSVKQFSKTTVTTTTPHNVIKALLADSADIEGTALPGTDGNSGIAGHRDGFFRGLKDIAARDAIELETIEGKQMYRVERTWIVEPADVSVLDPTPVRSLTLVTCYPFYFVGSAPQRFIVRAVRTEDKGTTVPSR